MRAEGLTGRAVIDRFLMIDRFYWHSRESTNKSIWKLKTCRRESSYYKDYVCVSSFTDIRDISKWILFIIPYDGLHDQSTLLGWVIMIACGGYQLRIFIPV